MRNTMLDVCKINNLNLIIMMDDIYKMNLLEEIQFEASYENIIRTKTYTRVPGGWIYSEFYKSSIDALKFQPTTPVFINFIEEKQKMYYLSRKLNRQ